MIHMSLTQIAKTIGCTPPKQDIFFEGICTDSRKLKPHNLFVAIKGEHFDGHDFVAQAFANSASAALVEKTIDCPIPQLSVTHTLRSLGKITESWRDQYSLPIIGVTGSNGKTTVKNMIASILRAHVGLENTLATEGNLNNEIGVPLMLAKLKAEHRYAVLEMGMNHFGEIAYLTRLVKPSVAVITNAGAAHLEGVNDLAGVAKAKGEIFLGLQQNGTAVLNKDDAFFEYWKKSASHFNLLSFGLEQQSDVTAIEENNQLLFKTPAGQIDIQLPLLGKHNIMNALAACAATIAINIDLHTIKKGLETVSSTPGRMYPYVLPNGTQLIDDTYNANPYSLQAAINTLASLPGQKIMVLGDMKELGDDANDLHFQAGQKIRSAGIDYLFTVGEMTKLTTEAFGANANHFATKEKLIESLIPLLDKVNAILVKGSRSMKMEQIVTALMPHKH